MDSIIVSIFFLFGFPYKFFEKIGRTLTLYSYFCEIKKSTQKPHSFNQTENITDLYCDFP